MTINTKLGPIEGKVLTTALGRNVHAFRGIPFAKPPVGRLRFKVVEKIFFGWVPNF